MTSVSSDVAVRMPHSSNRIRWDSSDSIAFAMDLTPLVRNESLDIAEYVDSLIGRFRNEVMTKIKKKTRLLNNPHGSYYFTHSRGSQRSCSRLVARQVREKPESVLGLATGGTPCKLYQLLARMHRAGSLDFSRVTTFNLDEYIGLDPSHPASYHRFMEVNFFSHVNISRERIHIPDGLTGDVPAHCTAYERAIHDAGKIDLQILGLGSDGHLGFNEPGSSLASRTRIKTLTERTRSDNERFFTDGRGVPHHVITMGLGTIMESGMCLLAGLWHGKKPKPWRLALKGQYPPPCRVRCSNFISCEGSSRWRRSVLAHPDRLLPMGL